jgi:hypothetical protein
MRQNIPIYPFKKNKNHQDVKNKINKITTKKKNHKFSRGSHLGFLKGPFEI